MSQSKLRGIYAMLVTPFDKAENVDYAALRAQVDWCAEQGVEGVVATPSIGEFACLSNEERWKSFEVVREQASKHKGMQAIATIAAPYTREVLEHARVAKDLDFAAAQLIPPYYWIPDEDEVYRHFALAAETGLPIVAYHNPMLSKFFMEREFVGRLADIPGVIAMKEVKTDRHIHLEPLFNILNSRLDVFTTFRAFTTGLILGSSGGFINVFAVPFCVKMWKLFNEDGRSDRLENIQNLVNEVFPRGGEDNKRHIGSTKMAASVITGIEMGPPRSPYLTCEARIEEKLRSVLPKLEEACR
jgi:dihydrodipicolinate synthase/N-acetylneuraminate lyase